MNCMRMSGVALAAWLLGSAWLTGCADSSQPANAPQGGQPAGVLPAGDQSAEEHSPEADELRAYHRNHHVGFIGFALMSIPSLGVTPEQQAQVENLRHDIHTKFQPAHEAEAALLNVMADGVQAGTIDVAKVDAATAKIVDVSTQMDDVTNDAINQLHAILNGPERAALADKIEAQYMIWHKANAEDDAPAQPGVEHEGHFEHIAKMLALTPDQVDKARAGFAAQLTALGAARGKFDPAAAEAHLQAFVHAFSADQFDAKAIPTSDKANSSITGWGAMRMARFYEALTPVLTPDQRTKLAALLREHATKLERK